MKEITVAEALNRMDNGEIVERYNDLCDEWFQCRKRSMTASAIEWRSAQGTWIPHTMNFGLIKFIATGKYRLPEPQWKEVPWYEAIEWMRNNPGKIAQISRSEYHTEFFNQSWEDGEVYYIARVDLNRTWRIPV